MEGRDRQDGIWFSDFPVFTGFSFSHLSYSTLSIYLLGFEKLDFFLRQAHTQNKSKYWKLGEEKGKKKGRGGPKYGSEYTRWL